MSRFEHVCDKCFRGMSEHSRACACGCGDSFFPPLCCKGCGCESFEDAHAPKCPPGVATATITYDAGEGLNAGICCGCGMSRDDHAPGSPARGRGREENDG